MGTWSVREMRPQSDYQPPEAEAGVETTAEPGEPSGWNVSLQVLMATEWAHLGGD
jgi:hypothetical protein